MLHPGPGPLNAPARPAADLARLAGPASDSESGHAVQPGRPGT
ncbi:MAG TPA: hypothetical protein VH637_01050 [Streptosporangiaceae bacterium]